MKIRKRSAILALLVALLLQAIVASAQGTKAQSPSPAAGSTGSSASAQKADAIPAPYPTRLRVSVKENLIILSWTDSPDIKGKYAIYRSIAAIKSDTFSASSRLGEVASGAQTYTDSPPDTKPYFYAVLALADNGTPYQVFVPAKNATSVAVSVGPSALATASALAATSAKQDSAHPGQSFVSAISAKPKGDAIIVSYTVAPKSRLVLYRGTTAIKKAADLLDATLVATFADKDGSFVDFPVPGVDYYYAILGEADLKAARIIITAGVNSLTQPAQVPAAAVTSGITDTPPPSRTPPLPSFLMEDGALGNVVTLQQDEGPPPARPLSSDTEKAIAVLMEKAPKVVRAIPSISVLPEELSAPSGGEDYALSIIVGDRIAAKDWPGAEDQLRKYLSLNRGPKASARAHFYLGEALTFKGSAREACFEFLSARDFYPLETKPWIEYVLSVIPND
jgi:hypothetical protein